MNKILKEIIDITGKLIKYKTVKENYNDFYLATKYIKKIINKDYFIIEKRINEYPNLIISNTEDNNLDIIFCGHLDVVPNETYQMIETDDKLLGRGAFDMKGQLATMISLLNNNKTDKKIALIITCDEEIGGFCCKEIMKEYKSKLAVIPDAGKNFELISEEKGLLQVAITTPGLKAHASEPFKGDNAILKSIDLYDELVELYPLPKDENDFRTSINLSKIEGGNTTNAVADSSTMTLDIRFTTEDTIESILNNIKKISPESKVEVLDQGPTFYVDTENKLIKDFLKKGKEILGHDIKVNKCLATSDAIYFSAKNIPTILINPIGDYWHNKNEYVMKESLYTLYLLFKEII